MREYRVVPDGDGWVLQYPESLHFPRKEPLVSMANRLIRHEPGAIKITVLDGDGNVESEVTRGDDS